MKKLKKEKKPRTYTIRARKDYLKLSKKCRPSRKERRKGIKKQIQYIQRNLTHIEKIGVAESGYEYQFCTYLKVSLSLAFKNLIKEDSYLKSATPENKRR